MSNRYEYKVQVSFYLQLISIVLLSSGWGRDNASIELCGLNYTNKHIEDFSVNGYSGASVYANGGGGSFVCCVLLPRQWSKDLRVTVKWKYDVKNPDVTRERIVVVPKYSEADIGFLAVHFYSDDTVKVLVTTKTNQFPGYPYPRPNE